MAGQILLALGLGILAAVVRLVLVFFPAFNVPEVAMFAGLGAFLGHRRPRWWWLSAIIVSAPALGFVLLTLLTLGTAKLRQGIGTWHLYSAFLIPLAALLGSGILAWRRWQRAA